MIYLEIKGRFGNQFFRYAFARWLQIKRGRNEKIMLGFSNMKGRDANDGWVDSLIDFQTLGYTVSNQRLVYKYGNILQIFFDSLYFIDQKILCHNNRYKRILHASKWIPFLNKLGLIHNVEQYHDYIIPSTKNIFVDGDFQCSKYFNDIRDVLLAEFQPKQDTLPHNIELLNIIKNNNSVCISIRRGDYISVPEFNKEYNICTKEYFNKAVATIRQKVDKPYFIIFSDDIDWCKQNVNFGPYTFYEKGDDPIWEKIRLMSSCKHFVLSNSSFSWVAYYLGKYKGKIVVSPDRWYNDSKYPNYLIENDFIKIPV